MSKDPIKKQKTLEKRRRKEQKYEETRSTILSPYMEQVRKSLTKLFLSDPKKYFSKVKNE